MENVNRAASSEQGCAENRFEEIIGNSLPLESVLAEVERVAPTDSTVLVLGETGTGKELIARAIHNISPR
jgi:formate hydrogenlyase transcriptional activator